MNMGHGTARGGHSPCTRKIRPVRIWYAPPKSTLKIFQIDFKLLKTPLRSNSYFTSNARVVKLVDTLALGASA